MFRNGPPRAAEHRAHLLAEVIAPMPGGPLDGSGAMGERPAAGARRPTLWSGEPGPFARLPRPGSTSRACAGALTAETAGARVPPPRAVGRRGFEVGIAGRHDRADLAAPRGLAGPDVALMADAPERAAAPGGPGRVRSEEPLPADAPGAAWAALAAVANPRGPPAFEAAWAAGVARPPPDPTRWGELSGALGVARRRAATGAGLAARHPGGGVGLVATTHLARAAGAPWPELEATENPLRDGLLGGAFAVEEGRVRLAGRPGHGATPEEGVPRRFLAARAPRGIGP